LSAPQPPRKTRPWSKGSLRGVVVPGFEDLDPGALPWETMRRKEPLPREFGFAKRSKTRYVLSLEHAGERIFIKRAEVHSAARRLVLPLTGTKSRREFDIAREFLRAGVIVPRPVLYAEARDGSVSYLATIGLPENWPTLHDYLEKHPLDTSLLTRLAHYTAWLHSRPVYHHDYRTDHIYVIPDAEDELPGSQFALIDLDGAFTGKKVSLRLVEQAFHELFLALGRHGLEEADALLIAREYEKAGGLAFDAERIRDRAQHEYRAAKITKGKTPDW
jgi:tRNA A-37 threonylcarbamoyl transferase component Bud32